MSYKDELRKLRSDKRAYPSALADFDKACSEVDRLRTEKANDEAAHRRVVESMAAEAIKLNEKLSSLESKAASLRADLESTRRANGALLALKANMDQQTCEALKEAASLRALVGSQAIRIEAIHHATRKFFAQCPIELCDGKSDELSNAIQIAYDKSRQGMSGLDCVVVKREEWDTSKAVEAAHAELIVKHSQLITKLAASRAALTEAKNELAEDTTLREKLADILTRTANALKGPPAKLSLHSWHDLPEVARAALAREAALRTALEDAIKAIESAPEVGQAVITEERIEAWKKSLIAQEAKTE